METHNKGKTARVMDAFVTVQKDSFAAGKQIRDILWPANLFVLSVRKNEFSGAEVDVHGAKALHSGDTLHVRYSTYNDERTKEELMSIVGEQEYAHSEVTLV